MRYDRVGIAADDRTSQIGKSIEVSLCGIPLNH